MLTIAFIFATQGCNPAKDCAVIRSENITVHVAGVSTYSQAVKVARDLKEKGCMAIELCPAFGHKGTACVKEAVGEEIPVGVVRFDAVPALGGKSGDVLFDDLHTSCLESSHSADSRGEDEALVEKLVDRIVKELRLST